MLSFRNKSYKVSFSNSSFSTSLLKTFITSFEACASSLRAAIISAELSSTNDNEAKDPTDLTCSKFGRFGEPIPPNEPELADLFSLNDFRILLRA